MKQLFLLFIGFIFFGSIFAQNASKDQVAKVKEVHEKLLKAIDYQGSKANKPTSTILGSGNRIASTDGNNIFIRPKVYKLLEKAKVLDEGLALIIGHELGHISESHPHQRASFSVVPLDIENYERSPCDEECKEMEQFCDYFGCFAAYRAGYNVWRKVEDIMNVLCVHYDCSANEVYKSKEDRIRALQALEKSVEEMSRKFDTANDLTLIGKHAEARTYYQSIHEVFPSREIKNNIALTYLLESLPNLPEPACCFAYPFELDHETRLQEGVRGEEEEEIQEAYRLVAKATATLDALTGRYPEYTPALFNLGCAYLLNEEYSRAMEYFDDCISGKSESVKQRAELGKALAKFLKKSDDKILLRQLAALDTDVGRMAALNLKRIEDKACENANAMVEHSCKRLLDFPPSGDLKVIPSPVGGSKISLNYNDPLLNLMDKSVADIERQFCTPYSIIPLKSGICHIYKHKKKYQYRPDIPGLAILFEEGKVVEYFLFYEEWE